MRNSIFGFLLILTFFSTSSHAGLPDQVDRLSAEDRMIYYSTTAMCERGNINVRDYAEKANLWAKSYKSSGFFNSLRVGRSPLRPSPEFETLTSSWGFFYAMKKCFGDDQVAHDLFFVSLLSLDISGKFTSWVVDMSLLKSIFAGLSGATAAGVATVPSRIRWFRTLFATVWAKPIFYSVTVNQLFVTAFTAETAADLYLEYAKTRDRALIASGNTREKIEILEEENALFRVRMAGTTQKDVIELYQVFIRQNERAIVEIREAQKMRKVPA